MFEHKSANFHLLLGILSTQTSYPIIGMSRSAIKHRLSPLSFLICIRHKLHLPIYPPNTCCTCRHHDHDIFGDHNFYCDKDSVRNVHTTLSLMTLLLFYPQHWRKQNTSTQTPNWTSKCTFTSDLTPLHDRLTYRST